MAVERWRLVGRRMAGKKQEPAPKYTLQYLLVSLCHCVCALADMYICLLVIYMQSACCCRKHNELLDKQAKLKFC